MIVRSQARAAAVRAAPGLIRRDSVERLAIYSPNRELPTSARSTPAQSRQGEHFNASVFWLVILDVAWWTS